MDFDDGPVGELGAGVGDVGCVFGLGSDEDT